MVWSVCVSGDITTFGGFMVEMRAPSAFQMFLVHRIFTSMAFLIVIYDGGCIVCTIWAVPSCFFIGFSKFNIGAFKVSPILAVHTSNTVEFGGLSTIWTSPFTGSCI